MFANFAISFTGALLCSNSPMAGTSCTQAPIVMWALQTLHGSEHSWEHKSVTVVDAYNCTYMHMYVTYYMHKKHQ